MSTTMILIYSATVVAHALVCFFKPLRLNKNCLRYSGHFDAVQKDGRLFET